MLDAAPAHAAWPAEYWFQQLGINQAWTVSRGAGITVAVVDSGVVDRLGDLRGQVLPGADFSGKGTDGRSDPGAGCDQYGGCYSHGTQMALLIAGTGRGKGFQGVAPRAKILPVKVETVTDKGDFGSRQVAQGIRWAVDHGAQIVSISLAVGGACDDVESSAVKYAYQHDVIVVAAAGNQSGPVMSPANCPGALAIGGVDRMFNPWSGSNHGPEVDFSAAAADTVQETLNGTELLHASGTSDAAAIVSGEFALIRAHFPHMSAREIVTRAIHTAHNGIGKQYLGKRVDDTRGYGEVLPYFAMTLSVPATASNPIYDGWAKKLGPPTPNGSGSDSSGSDSRGPASNRDGGAPAAPSSRAPSGIVGAKSSSSGGSNAGLIGGIAAAAVVVLLVAGLLLVRQRRARHATSAPPSSGVPPAP